MIRRRKIFLTCFACSLGFALTVLTLVYLTIPPMKGVGLSSWDIILVMFGDTLKFTLEVITLVLTCGLAASLMTRVMVDNERQQLMLRKQLFVAYSNLQQSQDELRTLKDTLKQVTKLSSGMAERLRKLGNDEASYSALTPGEYEGTESGKGKSSYIQLALENVSDELSQASTAMRDIMPSANALEHTLTPLSARAGAAGEALAVLDRIVGRLNRLILNVTLEAARTAEPSQGLIDLLEEFKILGRETAEQAAAIGEQVWHVKETLSSTTSPLTALVSDADNTLRHLNEASDLLDAQWESISRSAMNQDSGLAIAREVAMAVEEATALEEKIHRLIAPAKREAA